MEGHIITGDFDQQENVFSIQKIKDFSTQTVLNEKQINHLYQYLKEREHETDGQIITLYDQMLIKLSQNDIHQLLNDLEKIQHLYH